MEIPCSWEVVGHEGSIGQFTPVPLRVEPAWPMRVEEVRAGAFERTRRALNRNPVPGALLGQETLGVNLPCRKS